MDVERTNGIPICPTCKVPTKRQPQGSTITAAYYPPVYDENGVNTNPDRNTITTAYTCLDCSENFVVAGNPTDGYNYR